MRPVLVGALWVPVLYLGSLIVGGGIAGVIASTGAHHAGTTFGEGYAAGRVIGEQAGLAFAEAWRGVIFLGSIVVAAVGTYRCWLPGTVARGHAETPAAKGLAGPA
jgi:hypothetical protein